jgi:hypothetical protein
MTALREDSKCSFTMSKLRCFILARLALLSLATFFNALQVNERRCYLNSLLAKPDNSNSVAAALLGEG